MPKTVHLDHADQIEQMLSDLQLEMRAQLELGRKLAVTVAAEDEMLSPAETAGRLRLSRQHVRRLVDAGELEGERMPKSNYWKIPLASILAFEQRRSAASERADAQSRELDELGAPLE